MKRAVKIIAVILLILLLHTFFYRMSPFTTYIPLTGRLLSVDAEDLEKLTLVSISFGEENMWTDITDPRELEELCNILNGFRYSFILPEFLFPAYGGWDNRVILTNGDAGEKVDITFSEHCLIFRGVRFYPRNDALDELMEFVMEKAEFFKNNV